MPDSGQEADSDLLQLAAKAAGYKKYFPYYLGRSSFVVVEEESYSRVKRARCVVEKLLDWNPLEDDGDALRLSVALGMTVMHHLDEPTGTVVDGSGVTAQTYCANFFGDCSYADTQGDRARATRKAIVLAAAAAGRKL